MGPGHLPEDLLGTLDIDVQNDVDALLESRDDFAFRGPVQVVVVFGPFQELLVGDHGFESGPVHEVVVLTIDLVSAGFTGRVADRMPEGPASGSLARQYPIDQCVLSRAGWRGHQEQLSSSHDDSRVPFVP